MIKFYIIIIENALFPKVDIKKQHITLVGLQTIFTIFLWNFTLSVWFTHIKYWYNICFKDLITIFLNVQCFTFYK